MLTCLTCKVKFSAINCNAQALYREHAHSEWHKYNIRRAITNLPVLSEKEFNENKNELKQMEAKKKISTAKIYCEACRKMFTNEKSYNNHIQSKKHIERERNTEPEATQNEKKVIAPAELYEEDLISCELCQLDFANSVSYESHLKTRKHREKEEEKELVNSEGDVEDYDTDDSFELVSDDEWDGWNDEGEIPVSECLFCPTENESMEENLEHMKKTHAFYIPDEQYCVDVKGLLEYLGRKVGCGFACAYCYNGKKSYPTLRAVRNHMEDKFHMRYDIEGRKIMEYIDYYDYSSSYPDADEHSAEDSYQPTVIIPSDYELPLPSGGIAHHRYWKKFMAVRNNNALIVKRQSQRGGHLLKAIGGPLSHSDRQKLARDKKREVDSRKLQALSLGMKANKFQPHFRAQVMV